MFTMFTWPQHHAVCCIVDEIHGPYYEYVDVEKLKIDIHEFIAWAIYFIYYTTDNMVSRPSPHYSQPVPKIVDKNNEVTSFNHMGPHESGS